MGFTVAVCPLQAEAYVNTTSNDLVLSIGAVSNSILKAAGQTIQDECSKHVSNNGRLQAGDVVVTGAGNLACKHIIHTTGSNYDISNASNSEKVSLHVYMQICIMTMLYISGIRANCTELLESL